MKKQKALVFNWESAKAARNEEKYGVSFEEAKLIFSDKHAVFHDDVEHSQKEKREIVIGRNLSTKRHITCFFTRVDGIIQIIGARLSTHREKKEYKENSDEGTRIVYQIK
ncbi:MAG TPA: BrnT family toxin [Anaerolineales bacterium]|nr:BrnT family toxin [Anaerolineales bacterium]HNA88708.1 BrnT family toxin [Anaerolineales bacterium]HNB36412.1 BrnT family toxin [Anaerolineales bacterium]HNC08415.1 BrnT family toxin [Anaerolineales bacterium]